MRIRKLIIGSAAKIVEGFKFLTNSKPLLYGENQVKEDMFFGEPRSERAASGNRGSFRKTSTPCERPFARRARACSATSDFLLGLKGLQLQVRAGNISRMQRKFNSLGSALDHLIQNKEEKDQAIDTGIAIAQVAALFLPAGSFFPRRSESG